MKTDVCITVDVEFTIGGAFADPENKQPVGDQSILCAINGKSHGLGFILDTLQAYSLPATFFVETLNRYFFGDKPMARFAKQIRGGGHDVQLHLHPCWRHFQHSDWQNKLGRETPNDSMAGRDIEELQDLMLDGMDTLQRWGLPTPIALRTGGLQVDSTVYAAMEKVGLTVGSNIGVGIHPPREPHLHLYGGHHLISNIMEVPTLSYEDLRLRGKRHLKTLTITGSSWQEIKALLWMAQRKSVSPVVILTHPSEFVKHQDVQYRHFHVNRLNQHRLIQLCRFLRKHHDVFNVTTLAEGSENWSVDDESSNPRLHVPLWATAKRLLENRVNDYFPW